MNNYLNLTNNN